MTMFSHVLIPLDGSPLAEKAVDYVKHIVRPQGKVTLLTAVSTPLVEASPQVPSDKGDGIQAYMETIASRLKLNGFEVQIEIRAGEPAAVIGDLALHLSLDAIIMSTHGRSGLERVLFGSVTSQVLNMTPCPVLVIPNRERQRVEEEIPAAGEAPDLTPGLAT
jgi:nucleotide-binding universal stress UspA family protein